MAGEIALASFQTGTESTPGTAVAATRVNSELLGGWMAEKVEREFPLETRGSFEAAYRNFALKNYIEAQGITIAPQYESFGQWLQLFLAGISSTGATVAVTGKQYVFQPTLTANNLKTYTGEFADLTTNWQVPYLIGNKLEMGFARNGAMSVSMDLLGQQAVGQAKTGSLSAGAYEDIDGALATWTIDTTTIGSTAVVNVLDGKFVIDNGWMQDFVMDGNLYPRGAHRSKQRSMQLDMTVQFIDTTEYNKFTAPGTTAKAIPRLIRLTNNGTAISGSTGPIPRSLVMDWYGVWQTADFGTDGGMRVVKLSGISQYNAGVGYSWIATLTHALSPLP